MRKTVVIVAVAVALLVGGLLIAHLASGTNGQASPHPTVGQKQPKPQGKPQAGALAITSSNGTSFAVGQPGTFTVTTSGSPIPTLQEIETLPNGVNFTDRGNGTGVLAGKPQSATVGTYLILFSASNGSNNEVTQNFFLTIDEAPTITGIHRAVFSPGSPGSFTVTSIGSPLPTLSESGALPAGVTFTNRGKGVATLAGTPVAGTEGLYRVIVTAANGVPPAATQSFIVTVGLVLNTASLPNGTKGKVYSTTISANGGHPPYQWNVTGGLPPGLHLNKSLGVISGRPKSPGTFSFAIHVVDTKTSTSPPTQNSATRAFSITIR
jgi:hypothetical protein